MMSFYAEIWLIKMKSCPPFLGGKAWHKRHKLAHYSHCRKTGLTTLIKLYLDKNNGII
jgi:hypothetical protein